MNFNKVFLGGNMTKDPELRYTPQGTAVANFGIAVNRKYGEKEEVLFVNCTAWQKTAEFIEKYFTKGQAIFIEGRLQYRTWESKDGKKNSTIEVVVEQVQFAGPKKEEKEYVDPDEPEEKEERTPGQDDESVPF